MIVDQFPDRIIHVEGIEYLYFGGTNYLGMSTNSNFQNILFNNIKKWGTSYGSSRNANIKLSIYETAEKVLAKNSGTEAALTVSSGMLAGKLVADYLSKTTDAMFHFPDTHPAIMSTSSLPIVENAQLNSKIFDPTLSKITILTDAFPLLYVKSIDLNIINQIPNEKEITLVIDESHSFGIYSNEWCNAIKKKNITIIKVASLGKAFGLSGGFIAANKAFIFDIRNQDTFIGASGMNPSFLETFLSAQDLYEEQKQKLYQNLQYIDTHFTNRKDFTFNPNYPVIYFEEESISKKLFENKIITTSFIYTNTLRKLNRIVITANHTIQDLKLLISQLNSKK